MKTFIFSVIGLFLVAVESAHAGGQLSSYYEALAKDHRAPTPITLDLYKVVPSEEIPAILHALGSGDEVVKAAAVRDAIAILRIHKIDGENPQFRLLKPPFAEVIEEFQSLIPVISAHFDDAAPHPRGATLKDEFPNTPWKIQLVEFMDLIRAPPTPAAVDWMLKVLMWPKGRAQDYVTSIEKDSIVSISKDEHDAFLRSMRDHFRSYAIAVAPVLAHLNPMPPVVATVLLDKVDDPEEPLVAGAIIQGLAQNNALGAQVADRLVSKALDTKGPVDVRIAAILAVKKLQPGAVSKLSALRRDADERIAGAVFDIGVR